MKVYDYKCRSCQAVHEHFVANSDVHAVSCRDCGAEATRLAPCPRFKLDGCDPGYPTAYDKWAKDHEKAAAKANKRAEEHGE